MVCRKSWLCRRCSSKYQLRLAALHVSGIQENNKSDSLYANLLVHSNFVFKFVNCIAVIVKKTGAIFPNCIQ